MTMTALIPAKHRPVFLALAAAALFGAGAPLAKSLLVAVEPIPMAALLYLGSGLGAFGILAVRRLVRGAQFPRMGTLIGRNDLPWLAAGTLAGGIAAPIALMIGLSSTPAGTASLLLTFEAVATTLIAAVAFREATGPRLWLAVVLVTTASVLLGLRHDGGWGFSVGAIAVIAACVLWGLDTNLMRPVSARDPIAIVAIKCLASGGFSLVLALALHQALPSVRVMAAALILGFASYGLSIALFIRALRDLGAARTAALFSTAPFLGAGLSFIVFPEIPSPLFLASGALMVAGTALIFGEAHHHAHDHPALDHDHPHRHDDGHHEHHHEPGEIPASGYHAHRHTHEPTSHAHPHTPDIHHQHGH